MPMLDFKCKNCGNKFEELVFSYNLDNLRCPQCKSAKLSRLYEGKCLFGSAGSRSKSSCSGKSCSGCSGCSH